MVWFKIMIKFQDEMHNLVEFTHFEKFIFIQQWLTKKCDILGQLCVFLLASYKKNSIKNSFIWKSEKGQKRTHSPFVK